MLNDVVPSSMHVEVRWQWLLVDLDEGSGHPVHGGENQADLGWGERIRQGGRSEKSIKIRNFF